MEFDSPEEATLADVIRRVSRELESAGIEEPHQEARILLRFATCMEPLELVASMYKPLSISVDTVWDMVKRRKSREPLQYITGKANFYGRYFFVQKGTFIPRFDTELLVTEALEYCRRLGIRHPRIADPYTGSGVIPITLAMEMRGVEAYAGDISSHALAVARRNATYYGVDVDFCQGRDMEPFEGTFHVITANPPYIPTYAIANLQPEISYEPRLALDGGADGLDALRELFELLPLYLREDGAAFIEIDTSIAERVLDAAGRSMPNARLSIANDLSGGQRCLKVEGVHASG